MDSILLYAVVLLYSTKVSGLQFTEEIQIKNGSWLEAFNDCKQTKSYLPAYKMAGDYRDVWVWMDQNKIKSIWLALNKTRFPTWKWLDNEPVDHEFSKQNWRDFMNCGVLHLRDKAIEVDRCSKNDLGYVCTSKTATSCIAGPFHQSDCTKFDQSVYVYGCGAENWYDARYRCKRDNMDLALMRSELLMRHLHQVWYKDIRKKCSKLWMGLRRNDWQYQGVTNQSIFSWQSFWALGEPSDKGSCAVMSKRGGSDIFKWYAENCNRIHTWFCSRERLHETTVVTNIQEETTGINHPTAGIPQKIPSDNPTKGPIKGSNALAIALPIILVVAAITVLGIILIYRRRNKWTPRQIEVSSDRAENIPLVGTVFQPRDSEITLSVPEGKLQNCNLKINASMKPSEYGVNITEKLLSPVVTVVEGFNMADGAVNGTDMTEVMTLTIPHKLSIPNCEQYITVYKRQLEEWIPLKQGTKETVGQEELAYVLNDHISVVLYHPTTVMCTCKKESTSEMNLTAVLFYKYYKEKGLQEINLKLYFVDSMYTIKDCIKTLEDEAFSYILIQVYPSAVQGKSGDAWLEIDFVVEDDWNIKYKKIGNTQDQHLQFQDLQPTANDPIGVLTGKWIVQNKIEDKKADSLKLSLRVTFPKHNDILCQTTERLSLKNEDDYPDDERD